MTRAVSFNARHLAVVNYCAEEVGRQYAYSRDPETAARAVAWMVQAWQFAGAVASSQRFPPRFPDLGDIESIGRLVEPHKNAEGFRTVGVRVGQQICPPPGELPRLLGRFRDALSGLKPWEAYLEFERIHPFRDGNGRTGKVVLNWLADTMDNPYATEIPNPWGIDNP